MSLFCCQFLLNELLTTVRRVKLEVRPLFLPQLVRLTTMLTPALTGLNWTDPGWRNFVRSTTEAIRSFDVLVTRYVKYDRPCSVAEEPESPGGNSTPSSQQGQDWSVVWECFENPQMLLAGGGGVSRSMQDLVRNAVSEMRRYYSRKVIDVLIKVTRSSLDILRKRFNLSLSNEPVFLLNALLMIPNIVIRPSLEDVQEALVIAGRNITGVAKGVAQWTAGKQIKLFITTVPRRKSEKDSEPR